jgi:Xaa-Pro aminopeptidase
MKLMTWVPDVLSGWNWESAFDPWIAGLTGGEPIDIGSVGFERMRPALYRSVEKSLGNRFRLHAADAAIAACRVMRPRELTQLRAACALVTAAGDAFVEAWRQDGSVERAALAAERRARLSAAQDVRTLVSFDGGRTIAPVRGTIETTSDPLLGYVAVKHMGYWSDMFVAAARRPGEVARRVAMAMDTLLDAARPGIAARDLHARALKQIIPFVPHPVLGGSIGHRIGLSLNDGGDLTEEASHTLEPGDVYALHIGARDPEAGGAITSAMIAITATGAEILHRSPAQPAP